MLTTYTFHQCGVTLKFVIVLEYVIVLFPGASVGSLAPSRTLLFALAGVPELLQVASPMSRSTVILLGIVFVDTPFTIPIVITPEALSSSATSTQAFDKSVMVLLPS